MRSRTALSVGAALTLAVLTVAPAHAEFYSIDDPADASASLTDIEGMRVKHGTANVLVKVRFAELMRSSAAAVSVFIDADRGVKGPEYVLTSALGDGSDYVLTEADGWRGSDQRVDCDYDVRLMWGVKDTFRARVSRGCLGEPQAVRVSVKMVDQADGSHPVVDWTPKRHRWSLPVESGLGA